MLRKIAGFSLPGVALTICLALALPAQAEEKDQDAYTLESVTVTAQKREENVQEIPASVGVIDGIALDEERVYKLSDLYRISPNLYMGSGETTYNRIGIRGRSNSNAEVDPTLTVLIDDVPYDDYFTMASNLLFNVERVEVLRGPQSTMYGLNSLAGVVNIVTRQPDNTPDFSFGAELGAGPDHDGSWTIHGSASGPLVEDVLSGGLALMVQGQKGYIENLNTGENFNEDTKWGGRGTLVWTPTDAWNISLGLNFTDYDGDYGYVYLPTTESAAQSLGRSYEEWAVDFDYEGSSHVQTWAPNLKINYDAGPMEVVSITAFRDSEQDFDFDYDMTSTPNLYGATFGVGYMINQFRTFTQEIRLQSSEDDKSPFQWLAGAFYSFFERDQLVGMGSALDSSVRIARIDTDLMGSSKALFGQATYRLLDQKLGFTLGVRQEWTNRALHDNIGSIPDMDYDDSQFLPKFAVDYRFTPEVMAYASVTQGWRSGGLNNMATVSNQVEYGKETSWTYEAGVKTQLLDNRLLFNLTGFHTIYKDYLDLVSTAPLVAYVTNAPEVQMTGLEADLEARLTKNLLLTGGVGYVNAEYEDFPDAIHGNFKGNQVMGTPNFDGYLALRYSFLDSFYVRPEVQGIGTLYWDRANTEKQNPYALFNFRAGYAEDNWELYLFGENLTNQYAFSMAEDYFQNGNYYGTPITPLKVGMGLSWHF